MPLIPSSKQAPKPKPRAKRKPVPRGEVNLENIVNDDTPNPPTEPIPEPDPAPKTPKPKAGSLESRLAQAFASVAILPSFAGDQYSSFILASRSQKFSHDLAELAKVNPRVKKTLEGMLDGGAYGGVMFSGAAMLLPIIWSYGILPAPPFDPFSAFYPQVPSGVSPRSTRRDTSRSGRKGGTATGGGPVGGSSTGAPGPQDDPPPGVVTVRPGAHPPVSPAAM